MGDGAQLGEAVAGQPDDESRGRRAAMPVGSGDTGHGPTFLQALLTAGVLATATYLGAIRVLASEACAAIYVAVLGYVYRDIRRGSGDS